MNCMVCNGGIPEPRASARGVRYCSDRCAREANGTIPEYAALSTSASGALRELLVCADLLKRGYEVFRSLSPTASCDLIAQRGGVVLRVEVTAGYVRPNGTHRWTAHDGRQYKHDVIAYVIQSQVYYTPDGIVE